jgi:hypothetical protein
MILAIYNDGGVKGPPRERMDGAIKIAFASLKKNRLIEEASTESEVFLTPSGRLRNAAHQREPQSRTKIRRFNALYEALVAEDRTAPPREGAAPQKVPKGGGV